MSNLQPKYLKDYTPLAYHIEKAFLCFELDEECTTVTSKLQIKRLTDKNEPLILDGEKLKLNWVKLNGELLQESAYTVTETTLTIHTPFEEGEVQVQVQIQPHENTELEGLYVSGGIYCSQNEPEGFRRITYFIDRPDNMSSFVTKIIADKEKLPVILSNGNCIEKGDLDSGKHYAIWEDPFLKPAYLFALVAGDLGLVEDTFTTHSGRNIVLQIFTEKGDEERCLYAMDCLKRSMKWDEEVFGLEYDLDIYMIVAVHSFNMGAMENKGLNIFNTSCVFADPKSATDWNYLRVETVICHEYFHNWTGNRVTLRDWFQLTLKEGLTVFRDQEFSSDANSRAVKRIEDVIDLKLRQFKEDAGPNAHPIQPSSYIEMNNFYTATVYDKGAEVIRMVHTLLGKDGFRKGMDQYFSLFDGKAITTNDFIYAMETANNRDFTQFKRWYQQYGTPIVEVNFFYEPKEKTFSITIEQNSPKCKKLEPLHFPFVVGLIGADGSEIMSSTVLEVTEKKQTFTFDDIHSIPLPSLNRNFSAPIELKAPFHIDDYIFLMKHDTDPFNKFDAGQRIMMELILKGVKAIQSNQEPQIHPGFIEAFEQVLLDTSLDGAFKSKCLNLPAESLIAEELQEIDFDAIHASREFYLQMLAKHLKPSFTKLYEEYKDQADTLEKRKLKHLCLYYLSQLQEPAFVSTIYEQFDKGENMTEVYSALSSLTHIDCSEREKALSRFYEEWSQDPLVITKWFVAQATAKLPNVTDTVKALLNDPVYDVKIPNIVRALLGTYIENAVHFHRKDGVGYQFIADQILFFDSLNPLLAARLAKGFERYDRVSKERRKLMKKELKRILAKSDISTNVYEIINNILR